MASPAIKPSAFGIHTLTWCGILLVIGFFAWLNLDCSRDAYVEPLPNSWRGGLRQGFPLCWWDAGIETSVTVSGDELALKRGDYGGWQWLGLAADLALFAGAVGLVAFLLERLARARARRQGLSRPLAETTDAIALRPITVVVALIVLASSVSYNLMTFTVTERDGRKEYAQIMGWPFTTYTASKPELRGVPRPANRPLTPQDVVAYLDGNRAVRWRLAHWHTEGIILNSVAIMFLVMGSAFACESYLRRANTRNAGAKEQA